MTQREQAQDPRNELLDELSKGLRQVGQALENLADRISAEGGPREEHEVHVYGWTFGGGRKTGAPKE